MGDMGEAEIAYKFGNKLGKPELVKAPGFKIKGLWEIRTNIPVSNYDKISRYRIQVVNYKKGCTINGEKAQKAGVAVFVITNPFASFQDRPPAVAMFLVNGVHPGEGKYFTEENAINAAIGAALSSHPPVPSRKSVVVQDNTPQIQRDVA
jgi:hypothetical protein